MSAKRYFEFQDDKSNKFWEIFQDDCDVTTRWGKLGTGGQAKTKTYESTAAAAKEYAKLVREKTSKGYVESTTTTDEDPKTPVAKSPQATVNPVVEVHGHVEPEIEEPEVDEPEVVEPEIEEHAVDEPEVDEHEPANGLLDTLRRSLEAAQLDAEAMDALFAELPDEVQALAREEIDNAPGPNPEHLTLQVAQPNSIQANERTAAWLKLLKSQKANHIGDFVAIEFPVAMQVFQDKEKRLIVISYFGEHSWGEVFLRDSDEITYSWSNVPSHDGVRSPWSEVFHRPSDDLQSLMTQAEESGVATSEPKHNAKTFAQLFTDSFQLSMMWRNSIIECNAIRQPPAYELERKVFKFAREYYQTQAYHQRKSYDSLPSGKELMKAGPQETIEILMSALRMRRCLIEILRYDVLEDMCAGFLKRDLPFQAEDIDCLAAFMLRLVQEDDAGVLYTPFLTAVERFQKKSKLLDTTKQRLRSTRQLSVDSYMGNYSKERARISAILGDDKVKLPMEAGEAWVSAVESDLAKLNEDARSQWVLLFNHCVGATSAKWDASWKDRALSLLSNIGAETLHHHISKWLPALNQPRLDQYGYAGPHMLGESNQDILRGLAWCMALCPTEASPRLLAAIAISAFRKIPHVGSRAVRVGNACVLALNTIGTQECVSKLALLKIKVKNGTALRYIDAQLQKTAERLNVSRDDLEEMSIPAYGMEEVGKRLETMGDFVAEVTIDSARVNLSWRKPDGSVQKSVPAAVAADHAEELKELKADIKDMEKMLGAQRDRLENLYLRNQSWTYATWRERYLDHPLVGSFARRLIWSFTAGQSTQLGIYLDGELRGLDNKPLSGTDKSTVRLWHPLELSSDLIAPWRQWLLDHQVCQPFKQAHREIYVLTPAEVTTSVYSNRFAAHILRQSQYRALAQSRLWNVNLLGAWDGGDEGVAKRPIPAWGVRAEFWVTAANELQQYQEVTHIATDQVRFYRGDEREAMNLSDVAPLVFSEIMRDVDLFVGVASVGNDPNWFDHGTAGRGYQEYWQRYAFGDLSATGKTRHEVLERIVPRLKIARQCRLEDRFLIVEGKLRTYKIHLGSSNILMEPNDEYLCIVPDRKDTADPAFLPYEGDSILSIILSKALLLAQDDKIKDPTIVAQLKRG